MGDPSPGIIDELYEQARGRWEGVDLPRDLFATCLRERARDAADLGVLHAADLYLACACATDDPRALAAFEARYIAQVPVFLERVESSPDVIEEVRQLLRHRLFVAEDRDRRKILQYSGRGSLGSWVRVVTLRVASNRRRDGGRPHAHLSDDEGEAELLPTVDPELAIMRDRYKASFDRALQAAFASLTPRERLLFRMLYVDGVNLDGIGVVFQVHRATAARWLAAAREAVLERTMSLLGDELRVDASDFASLLRVVRSALDVSLQGLLGEVSTE
jgi:RNA polymerase sigma-70 factor (ECF subfamily)